MQDKKRSTNQADMAALILKLADFADSKTGVEGSLGVRFKNLLSGTLARSFLMLMAVEANSHNPLFRGLLLRVVFSVVPVPRDCGRCRRWIFLGQCCHVSCRTLSRLPTSDRHHPRW